MPHDSVTVRSVPEHETIRVRVPGTVGLVVSRMIVTEVSAAVLPTLSVTSTSTCFEPSPVVSAQENNGFAGSYVVHALQVPPLLATRVLIGVHASDSVRLRLTFWPAVKPASELDVPLIF